MYSHTKKVGSIGRYGPRINRKTREILKPIEDARRKNNQCNYCGKKRVQRKASGIWHCKSCNSQFTGGSHIQATKSK